MTTQSTPRTKRAAAPKGKKATPAKLLVAMGMAYYGDRHPRGRVRVDRRDTHAF